MARRAARRSAGAGPAVARSGRLAGAYDHAVARGARGGWPVTDPGPGATILLCKDFTSVLAQNRDARAEAMAALREWMGRVGW